MASKSSTSNDEPTPEQTDAPPEDTPPPEDAPPADESEGGAVATFDLPPTLKDAGLHGVVALTSGQYTTQSGSSFYLTPGQGYAMSPEDAQDLIDQGAAAPLDDTSTPT